MATNRIGTKNRRFYICSMSSDTIVYKVKSVMLVVLTLSIITIIRVIIIIIIIIDALLIVFILFIFFQKKIIIIYDNDYC